MKKLNVLLIVLVLSLPVLLTGQHSLMTFNLRYNNPNDGENRWKHRKEHIADMMTYYAPDIIGIQEGKYDQVSYLDSTLVDYSYVGVGRDDGKKKGEFCAIFYNTNRVKPLQSRTYWLSDTPDRVSVGWDASMERIVTYAMFQSTATSEFIHVFNCHFDHRGPVARENSAKLVNKLVSQKVSTDEKVIVMGDLNCLPDSAPIEVLKATMEDTYEISKSKPYGPVGTWCSFDTDLTPQRRIDYILTKNVNILRYAHLDDRRPDNMRLSDHLPVMVRME